MVTNVTIPAPSESRIEGRVLKVRRNVFHISAPRREQVSSHLSIQITLTSTHPALCEKVYEVRFQGNESFNDLNFYFKQVKVKIKFLTPSFIVHCFSIFN